MSDPDYVHQETQRSTAPVRYASSLALSTYRLIVIQLQSQTDLDEEFARRLVMEEQQSQSDWENQLGYQPRRQNNPQRGGGGPGDGGSGGKDTMSELSEQFNKFTESASPSLTRCNSACQGPNWRKYQHPRCNWASSPKVSPFPAWSTLIFIDIPKASKKTLSSFMTKVKAKVQEFDSK